MLFKLILSWNISIWAGIDPDVTPKVILSVLKVIIVDVLPVCIMLFSTNISVKEPVSASIWLNDADGANTFAPLIVPLAVTFDVFVLSK